MSCGNYNRLTMHDDLPPGTQKRLLHTASIPIRWGDMDAMRHVNNTVYFRFMEQTRIGWMDGMSALLAAQGSGTVIVSTSCNFRKPFTYPGSVEVRLLLGRVGSASITTVYEMRLLGEETLYADGEAVVVWVNVANGKAVRIPAAVRAALGQRI